MHNRSNTAKSKATRNSKRRNTSNQCRRSSMPSRNGSQRKNSLRFSTPHTSHSKKTSNHGIFSKSKQASTNKTSPHRSMLNSSGHPPKGRSRHSTRRNASRWISTSSRHTLSPTKNQTTPHSRRSAPRDETTNEHAAHPNSSASSTAHGSSMARNIGSPTIAPGNSAEAIGATAIPTTASVKTLARTTASASPACLSWWSEDSRDFSTKGIGLVLLIRGLNTGAMTGTTTTTFM